MTITGEEVFNYSAGSHFKALRLGVDYEFRIRAASGSREADYSIEFERFSIARNRQGRSVPLLEVKRIGTDVEVVWPSAGPPKGRIREVVDIFADEFYVNWLKERADPNDLMVNELKLSGIGREVFGRLGATRLYQLSPVESRKSGSPTPNPELDQHGGNLPAVVRYMQRNQPPAWQATLESMRRIVPGLEKIETDFTHDRRLALQFVESGAGRPWSSAEVSDGTIQSLALFTALFDPRVPLLIIEEPENSVHPWVVRTFVDACRTAANKRVMITTHSPALIAYLKPDEVTVVWRRDGRTQIRPLTELDPQALALWESGDINTFDIVDQGFVRETVPEGFA